MGQLCAQCVHTRYCEFKDLQEATTQPSSVCTGQRAPGKHPLHRAVACLPLSSRLIDGMRQTWPDTISASMSPALATCGSCTLICEVRTRHDGQQHETSAYIYDFRQRIVHSTGMAATVTCISSLSLPSTCNVRVNPQQDLIKTEEHI